MILAVGQMPFTGDRIRPIGNIRCTALPAARQPLYELQLRWHQMRDAVAPGALKLELHLTCIVELHSLVCQSRTAREGVEVVIVTSTEAPSEQAATQLADMSTAPVRAVAADFTRDASRARILVAHPSFDILVADAGGPPPRDFRQWERERWLAALDGNIAAPIALIRALVDGMMESGFERIISITSGVVKAPVDGLGLSTGAHTGLTGFVADLTRSTVARGVTINNLLPGTFDTARLAGNFAAHARREGRDADAVRAARISKHPASRLGRPQEFGGACAFLCSAHTGCINGQNLLLDGGSFGRF